MAHHPSPLRLRHLRTAVALASLLALSGCLGDLFLPGEARTPRGVVEAAFGKDRVQWFTEDESGGWTMRPALDGSRVYFERDVQVADGAASVPPSLVALDRATGEVLWHSPMTTAENAVLAGGRVGTVWGALSIFDPANGARTGTYLFGQTPLNGNLASDGARFYVTSHAGHVIAVDPATGQPVWHTNLAGGVDTPGFGSAVAGDGVAVVLKHFGTSTHPDTGIVAVVERATGAPRWRTTVQGAADPGLVDPPVVVGDLVIVATQGHDVRAFDLRTGALRWQADVTFATQEYGSNGLAECEGLVVVPTGDLGLAALDAATGALRWKRGDLQEGSLFGVQCSHGTVMTRGSVGLQLFEASTGVRLARYPVRDPGSAGREFWITSVVRDEQFLYVGTTYGFVKVTAP